MNITTFLKTIVKQEPVQSFQLEYDYKKTENTCNDYVIKLSPSGDLKRGFLWINWKFVEFNPPEITEALENASKNKVWNLILKKSIIPHNTKIIINLSYKMKINIEGKFSFSLFYEEKSQIVVDVISKQSQPFKRPQSFQFATTVYTEICDYQSVHKSRQPLNIEVSSLQYPQLNQQLMNFIDEEFFISIKQYTLLAGKTYDLKITAVLANQTSVITDKNILLEIKASNILVKIQGGENRYVDYKKPLTLQGSSRDLDIEDEKTPQDISLTWECIDMLSNSDCLNFKQIKLINDEYQGKDTFTIPENQLIPYRVIKFFLKGKKDSRLSEDSSILIISELDIPPLQVIVNNPNIYTDGVNLNEEIIAILDYDKTISTDLLTFAGSILYDNILRGAIVFDYMKVRFKIWNYYDKVTPNNRIVQVRFSVFNPQFVMPSISVLNIKINLPPQSCQFSVSPLSGIALSTIFRLTLTQCQDEDLPISYQFFYYKTQEDSDTERNNPNHILRRQISDQNYYSEIETLLPEGNLVLMALSIDSRQSIYNITKPVQVKPITLDEPSLLVLIDSFLSPNNKQQLQRNRVLDLSLLGEELSNDKSQYKSNTFSEKKTLLIQSLIQESKELPKSSSLQTFSNKVIGQLQKSLPQSTSNQNSQILEEVDKILSQVEPSKSVSENKNNDIHTQNIFDSFQMLTATTRQNKVENQKVNITLLSKQIEMYEKIGDLLNVYAFPNEGLKILQSDSIIIKSEKITAKNLGQYISLDSDTSYKPTTYDVAFKYDLKNMYQESESFQNYTSKLAEIKPGLKLSINEVIQLSIKINENQGDNTSFQPILKFSKIQSSNSPMTCISLNNNNWSNNNCLLHKLGNSQSYQCLCEKPSPTTIIEDAEALLNNKNVQTAFGSQGIENLSHFDNFYEYGVFWFLASATLMQVILWRIGKKLDLNSMDADNNNSTNLKVAPQPQVVSPEPQKLSSYPPKCQQDQQNKTENEGHIEFIPQQVPQNFQVPQDDSPQILLLEKELSLKLISQKIIEKSPSITSEDIQKKKKENLPIFQSNQSLVVEQLDDMSVKSQETSKNKNFPQKVPQTFRAFEDDSPQILSLEKELSLGLPSEQIIEKNQSITSEVLLKKKKDKTRFKSKQSLFVVSSSNITLKEQETIKNKLIPQLVPQSDQVPSDNSPQILRVEKELSLQQPSNKIIEKNQSITSEVSQKKKKDIAIFQSNQSLVVSSVNIALKEKETSNNNNIVNLYQTPKQEQQQHRQAGKNLPYFNKSLLLQLIIFHKFFNIFYTSNDEMARPIRFTVFYLQIVHQLAMSTLFNQKYKLDQIIMLSLINSIVMAVFVKFITVAHKKRKYISIFIITTILSFYFYLIFSIVSGQESLESNKSALIFIVMFSIDFFFISFLVAFLQRGLALIVISSQNIEQLRWLFYLFEKFKLQVIINSIRK